MNPIEDIRLGVVHWAKIGRVALLGLYRIGLYRNAFYLLLDAGISSVLGVAFWKLADSVYSTADVGTSSALVSGVTLVQMFATWGFTPTLVRFLGELSDSGAEARSTLISSCFIVTFVTSVSGAGIFILGLPIWLREAQWIRGNIEAEIVLIAICVAWSIYSLLGGMLIQIRESKYIAAGSFVWSVLRLAFLGTALLGLRTLPFFAWGIALILMVILLYTSYQRLVPDIHLRLALDGRMLKNFARYSLSNQAIIVLEWIPSLVLPFIVANRMPIEYVAFFFVPANLIAKALQTLPSSISTSLLAEGSLTAKQGTLRPIVKQALAANGLVVCAMIVLALLARPLLAFFGPAYLENGYVPMLIFILAAIPYTLNELYRGVKQVTKQMERVIISTAVTLVCTLGLAWILIGPLGLTGVALAVVTGRSLGALTAGAQEFFAFLIARYAPPAIGAVRIE